MWITIVISTSVSVSPSLIASTCFCLYPSLSNMFFCLAILSHMLPSHTCSPPHIYTHTHAHTNKQTHTHTVSSSYFLLSPVITTHHQPDFPHLSTNLHFLSLTLSSSNNLLPHSFSLPLSNDISLRHYRPSLSLSPFLWPPLSCYSYAGITITSVIERVMVW